MKEPKYKFIDIHKIEANGHQPRTHFENEKIQELAVSIQQNGLLQPIVVRPYHGKYQIVVGERRYRACLLAGIEEVPCLVQNYDEQQTATAAIVENIQRENLSAIEEALAYQQILDTQNITQEELAQKVGKKQSTIANKLRLLKLSDEVKDALKSKQITERHARAMLSLQPEKQEEVLHEVIDKSLNVKQTETLINKPPKIKKKNKGTVKAVSRNFKIAINTINQATDLILKSGVEVTSETEENDDEYVIILRVKK